MSARPAYREFGTQTMESRLFPIDNGCQVDIKFSYVDSECQVDQLAWNLSEDAVTQEGLNNNFPEVLYRSVALISTLIRMSPVQDISAVDSVKDNIPNLLNDIVQMTNPTKIADKIGKINIGLKKKSGLSRVLLVSDEIV